MLKKGGVMKYSIRIIIMMICFGVCISLATGSSDVGILEDEHLPGDSSRLQLVSVENNTEGLEFQIFPPLKASAGLSLPAAPLSLVGEKDGGITLDRKYPLIIKCSKGSYRSVFIRDGYAVSGNALDGYDGPFYLSMWLPYPNVVESSKLHIPYVVAKGKRGKIGLRIGSKGDYRLIAVSDVKFIH